jgi:hypothetical protein
MNPIPFQVFGINLLVRLMPEPPADVRVHCPKGSPIRYGEVVGRGDGFDEGANAFREMPAIKSVVAFEENPEEIEALLYLGEEHRVIRLDDHPLLPPGVAALREPALARLRASAPRRWRRSLAPSSVSRRLPPRRPGANEAEVAAFVESGSGAKVSRRSQQVAPGRPNVLAWVGEGPGRRCSSKGIPTS